jgi:tripartite-type tricarboxylate transporter receptor subunit TctC
MLEGRAVAKIAGESRDLGAGECCFFPAGVPHKFTVVSESPARALVIYSPLTAKTRPNGAERGHMKKLSKGLFAVCLVLASQWGLAQVYPSHPIKLVVPFAPGSATDSAARIVAQALGDRLKQSIVVENHAGASGIIAAELVAKSAPDGYTLFMTTNTTHSANPSMFKALPYDPITGFAPIILVGELPFVLVANNDLPVKTVNELVAYAKANPGKLSYPYASSTSQVSSETLRGMTGIQAVAIPYKSSPQATTDLIAGRTQFFITDLATSLPHIRAGKMRAIALTPRRTPLLPGIPAIDESLPGFDLISWNGILAPAGTPADIVGKLSTELKTVLSQTETREKLEALGFTVTGTSTPAQFSDFLKLEIAKWAKWVMEAGIQPE